MSHPHESQITELSSNEVKFLDEATLYLETPSLLMRIANAVGEPLELLLKGVEKIAPDMVEDTVRSALQAALKVAVYTLPAATHSTAMAVPEDINETGVSESFWHKVSVAITGSAGGLFGIAGLAIELPVTTTVMFRSIASIAREFGEDITDNAVRLQCLTVFSLGGPSKNDDALECTYLEARAGVQALFSKAAHAVSGLAADELTRMLQQGSAPAVVNLIARIAAQFNIAVTEKLVLQLLPVVGAAAGATVNVAFMAHFNEVARFHFGIRSLERKYGMDRIQAVYRTKAMQAKQVSKLGIVGAETA